MQQLPTPMNKLQCRITTELAKGKARRAVPPRSIPREFWLTMLRPRDPDIQETNRPIVAEADLNNRLLQTTSSKELLAIMREIREKQAANSEVPNKRRRHLPSVPKPCVLATRLMKRFKALISGLHGHIKEEGLLQTRGKDLHQCLKTKERRSQDQHVSDWYTCCVRLARLSM